MVVGYNTFGLALARYRPDGRLDPSFSGNGTVGPVVGQIFALAVALQPDGRIVVESDFDIFASAWRGSVVTVVWTARSAVTRWSGRRSMA